MLKNASTWLLIFHLLVYSQATCANIEQEVPLTRFMSVDWSQTETMLALGITPVASAQQSDYNDWVRSPQIPSETVDVGLRTQPNLERLSELDLDTIFLSPRFSSLENQLSRIAPVKILGLYQAGDVNWDAVKEFTRHMAREINAIPQADVLIANADIELNSLKHSLSTNIPPVLLVQFMDAKHVRVFGDNSIYQVALTELGIQNAWTGKTNSWGYSLVGVDRLHGIAGQVIIIDPLPAGVKEHLANDQYWHYIINQTGFPSLQIEPIWSFGALPSAIRFAHLITSALNKRGQ